MTNKPGATFSLMTFNVLSNGLIKYVEQEAVRDTVGVMSPNNNKKQCKTLWV